MANLINITELLQAAQSPDFNVRSQAEASLKNLETQDLPSFLYSLSAELANNEKPPDARRLAGLILKNTLDAKDEARKVSQTYPLRHKSCPNAMCDRHSCLPQPTTAAFSSLSHPPSLHHSSLPIHITESFSLTMAGTRSILKVPNKEQPPLYLECSRLGCPPHRRLGHRQDCHY